MEPNSNIDYRTTGCENMKNINYKYSPGHQARVYQLKQLAHRYSEDMPVLEVRAAGGVPGVVDMIEKRHVYTYYSV